MSVDRTKILFEGFLQKRKDIMKIMWVTYWTRLQNTTLFFYTKKNGGASHLKGNYYIYTVQSVREVHSADSKRFMFEIIMNNGKRKLLAAETAALRQEWLGYLWQAMHLSTSGVSNSRNTHDGVTVSLPARPLSSPAGHIHHEIRGVASPFYLSEELNSEEATYQNTLPAFNNQPTSHNGDSHGIHIAEEQGDYDVLPIRKKMCESMPSTEMDNVYDVPLSYRRAAEHPDSTESDYDVPSSLLRRMSDHTSAFSSEEQLDDGPYWRI